MKILLDAIPLQGLMTGISRYLRNLYAELERLPGVTVYYTDSHSCTTEMPPQANPGAWMKTTSLIWKLPDPLAFGFRVATWLAFEMRLRRIIGRDHFTLYHETAFTPAAVKRIPQVLTLHDLSLMKFREMHPKERVWFMQLFFHRRMRDTAHIITVSEFMRSQICDELHLPPHKVTAIHEAPDPSFSKRERESVRQTLHQLGLPNDYLLFVGTLEPRKNLPLLIRAAALCKNDIPIVLAGWKGWDDAAWSDMAKNQGMQNRIITTGYVDEETLACLYSAATALVFPSLYEGFGLPVLEAMACECPVICSNAASLPEVAGDAAFFVDPGSAEELASAMDKVVEDGALRNSLIQKGVKRAAQFSWATAAEKTLDVFRSVAGQDA